MKNPDMPLEELIARYRDRNAGQPQKVISLDGLAVMLRGMPDGTGRRLAEQCVRKLIADSIGGML